MDLHEPQVTYFNEKNPFNILGLPIFSHNNPWNSVYSGPVQLPTVKYATNS